MKRVLIINLWALGDILMATPLLTALKAQFPPCEITWLADTSHADILLGHPLVDDLICFDSGKWRWLLRKGQVRTWLKEACQLNAQMKERHFDAVINCHPEKWWTRIFCAAPVRLGLFPSQRLPPMRLLYTKALSKPPGLHNTDVCLRGVEALGLKGPFDRHMTLHLSIENREAAQAFLSSEPNYRSGLPTIILHPGTSQPSKCWPVENFAALAVLLPEYNIVVTGSPREQSLAEAVASCMPEFAHRPLIAAGRLSINATAALVEMAAGVVTGDTSILHIASALGTPLVGIYGSSRPGDNAPLFGPHRLLFDDGVPCAPCYREHCPLAGNDILKCQKAITPAQVFAALTSLLKEIHERSTPD